MFPAGTPDRYIEVFGGAGWVLFARDRHAKQEIYNDINGDLVNLFKCMQCHPDELQRQLAYALNSRQAFGDYASQLRSDGLTDIQRAARYYYVVKQSFGADACTWATKGINWSNALDIIGAVHDRLACTIIEHKSYDQLIAQYDRPGALIYCDPPYHGTEDYYSEYSFDAADHVALRDLLSAAKGKVIVTYNDDEQVREWYHDFKITPVARQNGVCNGSGTSHELIITNY